MDKIIPQVSSGIDPGTLGLWAGAVGSCHSSTCGYHFIVVVFILNTHYLLCATLYECGA